MTMIEVFHKFDLYARFKIDFEEKTLVIMEGPNKEVKSLNDIFKYTDGFKFNFETVRIFLKNRKINGDTHSGVYTNIADEIKVVVIRDSRIG